MRQMCGVTLKDRKSSEELRHRIGIENVADVIRRGRLRWFGHVERKEDNDWVKACQTLEIDGNRGKGRGKKTWRQCVDEDMKILKLNKKDTDNRMEWRSGLWGDRHDLIQQFYASVGATLQCITLAFIHAHHPAFLPIIWNLSLQHNSITQISQPL